MSSLQASYIVIHNGSGEILDASVDLTLGTLSSQQAIALQTFKVRFVMVGLSASLTLFPQPPLQYEYLYCMQRYAGQGLEARLQLLAVLFQ